MTNLSSTIIAKSDQLNSDDLIGRSQTIKIVRVSLLAGEQPISIDYEGGEGKPWKPCKSMRRVLVQIWGSDGNAYIGRSLTLYRDEKVTFGGAAVGGIRISHMSDIAEQITMSLTAAKAVKRPFIVRPLVISGAISAEDIDALQKIGHNEAAKGTAALKAWWGGLGGTKHKSLGEAFLEALKAKAATFDSAHGASSGLASG